MSRERIDLQMLRCAQHDFDWGFDAQTIACAGRHTQYPFPPQVTLSAAKGLSWADARAIRSIDLHAPDLAKRRTRPPVPKCLALPRHRLLPLVQFGDELPAGGGDVLTLRNADGRENPAIEEFFLEGTDVGHGRRLVG